MSGAVSQFRPSLADLLMGVQSPDGPIPLASMRMPSDLAGVPLASMFPVGQSLTMPSPDVSLMQPGSMPTTAQMAAQPVSQYVNPATGAFTPEGMQRARDVTDTAMAMGGVGPSGGGFRAYHGSPHAFDQFDLSKIGTGEGAQAYGHGMYLADAEGVARNYRDSLTPPQFSLEGVPHSESDIQRSIARKVEDITGNAKVADNIAINTTQMLKTGRLGELENSINGADQLHPLIRQSWQTALDHANAFTQERPAGHMYEVQVNADPAHFLDWDKPMSEQHPVVKDALSGLGVPDASYMTGQMAHDWLARRAVVEQNASRADAPITAAQRLNDAGIPGIRYLDAGSRMPAAKTTGDIAQINQTIAARQGDVANIQAELAANQDNHNVLPMFFQRRQADIANHQTTIDQLKQQAEALQRGDNLSRNTVVFDPATMDIIRRYGLAGLMAGGGAAAGMQQTGGDNTQ